MTGLRRERMALSTGIGLDVTRGGPGQAEPIVFLHGFPESHRTWRHQLADLSRDHLVIAPDQRGYAGSDKPDSVGEYSVDKIVADLMALADAAGIKYFTLVGHDWGGAAAWAAALAHPFRIRRLVIVNAPHPLIFQKSLIEDDAQRAASQYIRAFRSPMMEAGIKTMGLEKFFEKSFGAHADLTKISDEEKQAYLDEWSQPGALTGMLNWYRAAKIEVPTEGEKAKHPIWTKLPFPHVSMPSLVVWGLKDKALLPVQLSGLDEHVDDLRIVTAPDAGHFLPWEAPDLLTSAIRDFIAETPLD